MFILYVIGLVYVIYKGTRPFSPDLISVNLPNQFLELPSNLRKRALDFAWALGLEQASSIPFATVAKKAGSGCLIAFTEILFILSTFFLVMVWVQAYSKDSDPENTWAVFLVFSVMQFTFALVMLDGYYSRKKSVAQTWEEDKAKAQYNKCLKHLGIAFVQENSNGWVDAMDRMATMQAQKESDVTDPHSFSLFSHDFSLTPSGMPHKKLGVTYIFSNGFISIVSNVIFDLTATSYSYVDSDSGSFVISGSESWSTEEFHYQDVVECNYGPFEDDSNVLKSANKDYPIDGYLTLGLVNGSKKHYPTTKKAVANFLIIAREKVRSSKAL